MKESTISKITPLDYSILGLVSQNRMSGYAIRMVFQKTALGNYSSSPGTIYPALKRLEKLRLLQRQRHPNPKKQFVFAITASGMKAVKNWLRLPINAEDVAKEQPVILLRFAFMDGAVTAKQKMKFLRSWRGAVTKYIEALEDYHARESNRLPLSGRQAFEHGIESYKTTLKWIDKTISTAQLNNKDYEL
jgi:DNA-binding PadR family transcriptional regulator